MLIKWNTVKLIMGLIRKSSGTHIVIECVPSSVYRCKGIVFAAESPGKRLALQIVGRRTEITELDDWGVREPRSQIVAIGTPIDAPELSRKFDACLQKPQK